MASRRFYCYAVEVNSGEKQALLVPKKGQNRSYLLIENRSSANIFVNFDSASGDANNGVLVPAGGVWELDSVVPDNQIAIGGSILTSQRINVTEAF